MKKAVVIVLVLAAIVCAASAMAQTPAQGPGGGRRGVGGMFGMGCPAMALMPPQPMLIDRAESLNLPAETKDKLKAVLTKGEETLQPLRQKAQEASSALRTALLADEFSEAKVKQLAADAEKAEQAVVDAELGVWRDVRGALSADQVKALRELLTGGMRRAPGGAGGPGPGPAPQPGPPPAPPQPERMPALRSRWSISGPRSTMHTLSFFDLVRPLAAMVPPSSAAIAFSAARLGWPQSRSMRKCSSSSR